ncbi:NAD(P)-binding domain-containing protein [Nocardioides sp.]|uniref:NAD(P)-binding domain-containing protein n=1 Tax=Nocardioides sp. TaxID=35761 RepID=UPI00273448F9|nr:NAD(P)-binding domain-containing protein [Nocardioides sp.]MDP3892954.1 NAD(P)-binding domain-containing protein [Nocardioides sp.]
MATTNSSTTDVSVLGTGAVGTRITEVLIDSGMTVTVWNRTPDRARPLGERGAAVAATPLAAATASPLLLLTLTDHNAVVDVLDATAVGLAGRVVATLTTGTPDEARAAAERVASAGGAYLDGAVQTPPEDLGTEAAVLLLSGSPEAYDQHRDALELLGARHVGAEPAAAAVHDLALFGLWYDAQIAHLRALDIVRASGIDVEVFAPWAANQLQHVVTGAAEAAREVATRSYPRGPADLTEHAPLLDRIVALRRAHRLGGGGLAHVHRLVEQGIAEGRGHEGLTAILDVSLATRTSS